jgi:hypothetical protein
MSKASTDGVALVKLGTVWELPLSLFSGCLSFPTIKRSFCQLLLELFVLRTLSPLRRRLDKEIVVPRNLVLSEKFQEVSLSKMHVF